MKEDKFNSAWKPVRTEIVKSGKRTYFFDVRETSKGELYLSVTESKKVWSDEGDASFEKHTILVYNESFADFTNALKSILAFIEEKQPETTNNSDNTDSDYLGQQEGAL
ncbi:MAG: DUF3276 family protein [Bacteroidales bacterium]